jgi:DNA-directed RNA polymerase beta' subunit
MNDKENTKLMVINRCNRLAKLLEMEAPNIILTNELLSLREAINSFERIRQSEMIDEKK